ncbi:unnamed protein product [Orchesella dallaii]|uniref:MIF4G domain-containing protein n=1 Tax=Orchesella dallaii TaxID=48710 RepID=A0ABP1RF23_9HEXA
MKKRCNNSGNEQKKKGSDGKTGTGNPSNKRRSKTSGSGWGSAGTNAKQGQGQGPSKAKDTCSSSSERKGGRQEISPIKVAAVQVQSTSSSSHSVLKAPISIMSAADILNFDNTFPSDISKMSPDEIISSWNKRVSERQAFRVRSAADLYDEFTEMVKTKKLDSTLKKCTAFVKKMKQFPDSLKMSVETDLNNLNLTKYISEIALVIVEMKLKVTDVPSILSICSELHKRYPMCAENLLENFEKVLPSKSTKLVLSDVSKTATDLRIFVELIIGGIIPLQKGCSTMINCIQSLVHVEGSRIELIVLLVSLLHGLTDELTGVVPKSISDKLQDHVCSSQLKRCNALSQQVKDKLKGILKQYFGDLKKSIVKRNDKVLTEEKFNRKLRETKGEVPPDRQQSHDKLVASFMAYYECFSKLADLLNVSIRKPRQLPSDPDDEFAKALLMSEDGEILTEVPGIVLFEDEETRQFYQDLPDLKTYMSAKKATSYQTDLYSSKASPSPESEDDDDTESDDISTSCSLSVSDEELDLEDVSGYGSNFDKGEFMEDSEGENSSDDLGDESLPTDVKDDETERLPKGDVTANPSKLNFQNYLSCLKNCVNKNMIDKAAYDFVDNFKSKYCKSELVHHLVSVPRQRLDLVHLYARLIASLSAVYPDIGKTAAEKLLKEFRYHVLKKDQGKLESKLKVTRFIAELTNFSVLQKSHSFNCLKLLFHNFVHHQIDMACALIENCGGYLYRSLDSHRRMKLCLEEMMRRKSTKRLDQRYIYMVDSVYSQLCPPAEKSIQKKRKSSQQVFLEHILCEDLSKQSLERADKVLRMLDWRNEEVYNMAVTILSSPWKYSYAQLDSLAALLASLKQFRPTVTQAVVESISEQIRIGCENECEDINNFRTSTCQLFAHLYNYKNLSTTTLLNVWSFIINFGVTYNVNESSRMDPPDSLARVRLICHMLKIAGDYLSSERSNKRLEFFLKYFQRYYLFKRNHPIWQSVRFPHNIQEFYEDSMKRVKKGWKFVTTVEEAEKEIAELDGKLRKKVKNDALKHAIQNKSSVQVPVRVTAKSKLTPTYAKVIAKANFSQANSKIFVDNPVAEESTTAIVASGKIHKIGIGQSTSEKCPFNKASYLLPTVEEDEFEEAYATLCAESVSQSTEKARTPRFAPVEIPFAKMQGSTCSGTDALNYSNPGVKVTVLTKQNNKTRRKTLEVPPEEDFLKNIKLREQAERNEKQEVKSRTLELARLQVEEERRKEMPSVQDFLQKLLVAAKPNTSSRDSTK